MSELEYKELVQAYLLAMQDAENEQIGELFNRR